MPNVALWGTGLRDGVKWVIQWDPTWSDHTDLGKEIYGPSWQPGADEPQLWMFLSEQNKSDFSSSLNSAAAQRFACDARP